MWTPGRTISCNIIGGRCHLLHKGSTNILEPVLQLYGLRDRDTILGDLWAAIALLYYYIAALRAYVTFRHQSKEARD